MQLVTRKISSLTNDIPPNVCRQIANAGFICACLVVSIHIPHPENGFAVWLDRIFYGSLARAAVPMFFCISGYLLAGKMIGNWYGRELSKRVKSLLVPFFIWGGVALMSKISLQIIAYCRNSESFQSCFLKDCSPFDIVIGLLGLDITAMPLLGPLWFLRCLFLFVVLSPALCRGIRRFKLMLPMIFFVMYLTWSFNSSFVPEWLNGFLWYGLSAVGMFAFSFGIWMRFNPTSIIDKKLRFAVVVVGILGLALVVGFKFIKILPIMIPFWMYLIWLLSGTIILPRTLTSYAFPIYLMHGIFINLILSFPNFVSLKGGLVGYTVCLVVPIASSIVVSLIVNKWCPISAELLFGGRSQRKLLEGGL